MEKIIETIEKVSIEKRMGTQMYVINPEWEKGLYAEHISELNITSLINDGLIDPSNGLEILSSGGRVWYPYFCEVSKIWSYKY